MTHAADDLVTPIMWLSFAVLANSLTIVALVVMVSRRGK